MKTFLDGKPYGVIMSIGILSHRITITYNIINMIHEDV